MIFGFGIWIILNKLDLKAIDYPYLKIKFYLFLLLFIFVCVEIAIEVLYFSNIPLTNHVLCCSSIFDTSEAINSLPFGLNTTLLLFLFYLFFTLTILSNFTRNMILSFISNLIFLFVSYYAVTYFFGTYIYELPTHKCPFCMLQKEYYYIGYILWSNLFLGVFFGISQLILKIFTKQELIISYKATILFNTIFVILCTYFVIIYYIKNGVFL
ncbi:membrane protein, putative [hydrothermal vent metagenome]|uniref:Membrane protein, putative n=1 Tax=hydrothermal vent metagenome TaxID=652676 RepID=A0A3B1E5R0_9ZZZZ